MPTFETLSVTLENHIATVRLNRPDKANAMNATMWQEIRQAFEWVDATPEARVAVLAGEGKLFCAGIDLQMMMGLPAQIADDCEGRMREKLRRLILDLQDTLTSLERCRKPVLAAIAGGCIGGATTWLSRRGTPATDAPATVAPTVKPVESPLSSNEVAPAVPVPSEAADWVPPAKINPAPEPATDATLSMPVIA